jgi:methyl-accepting chemotaxis protein
MVDLSLSWQNESEDNAMIAKEALFKLFLQLEKTDKKLADSLRPKVESFSETMMKSVDSYVDENRVLGNSLVSDGRNDARFIEDELNKLLAKARISASNEGIKVIEGNEWIRSASLFLIVFATILSGILSYYFTRSITTPLRGLLTSMNGIAAGELKQEKLEVNSADEIGDLSKAYNTMLETLTQLVRQAEALAMGQLDSQEVFARMERGLDFDTASGFVKEEFKDARGDLADAFNNLTREMRKLTVQAAAIANDDLNNPVLNVDVRGELGDQFRTMIEKMQWFAGQATYIADNDVNNENLRDNGEGTLGSAMATMVRNLRQLLQTTQEQGERERLQVEELRHKVDSMLEVVKAAAEGDLTAEITVSGEDAIGQMGEGLSQFLNKLRQNITEIGRNAEGLATSAEQLTSVSQMLAGNAEETSTQANVVSAASQQVSNNVESVATGSEEMSASIKEIAQNSTEAANVVNNAVKIAEQTNKTISKLGDSSAEIGEVIKVITSIAEQTNLLALNATIEAARAGEAGKGFAVVANEVKELATQTSGATEDIRNKVETIQVDAESAVNAIAEISEVIHTINQISATIASAVEEQSATTNEIGRSVNEAARGTQEINQNITGVAQAAESATQGANDTQNASQELSAMAEKLQELVSQFKV